MRESVVLWEGSGPEDYEPFASRSAGAIALYGKLAQVLIFRGKHEEAETVLLECHDSVMPSSHLALRLQRQLLARLVRLYKVWDKQDQGVRWRDELSAID